MNENDIKIMCKEKYSEIHASEDLINTVLQPQANGIERKLFIRKSSAIIAMAALCVCLLGGSIALAVSTIPSLKNYYFPEETEHFEELYTPSEESVTFGHHKLIFEGSVYDTASQIAYLSLRVQNEDGTPESLYDFCSVNTAHDLKLLWHVTAFCISTKEASAYFVITNTDGCMSYHNESEIEIQMNGIVNHEEASNLMMKYVLLTEAEWNHILKEFDELQSKLKDKTYHYEINDSPNFQENGVFPGVEKILAEYGLKELTPKRSFSQDFNTKYGKLTVGRTNALYFGKYSMSDKKIKIIRADGSEIPLTILLSHFSTASDKSQKVNVLFGYDGQILGEDEIVTITVNGVEYK